jgi:hypothetical protein
MNLLHMKHIQNRMPIHNGSSKDVDRHQAELSLKEVIVPRLHQRRLESAKLNSNTFDSTL